MPVNQMKVHVIVLNYNGLEHLEACLGSLEKQTFQDFEVILADNGSTDGSIDFAKDNFPKVKIIEYKKNHGFAKGNNLAMEEAIKEGADYIALLNNDTEVGENWLKELVGVIESDPHIGACTSKMLLFDDRNKINSGGGVVNYTGHSWPAGLFEEDVGQFKKRMVDSPCAGAILFRRKVLDEVGLFDEDYFAYHEDTDLSWRMRLAGYKNYFVPMAGGVHLWGKGSSTGRFARSYYQHVSIWKYFLKHYPNSFSLLFLPILLLLNFIASTIFRRENR